MLSLTCMLRSIDDECKWHALYIHTYLILPKHLRTHTPILSLFLSNGQVGGHYYSYVHTSPTTWHKFNDSYVSQVCPYECPSI